MSGVNCRCIVQPTLDGTCTDDGDEVQHVFCCDPLVGLCGADLSPDAGVTDEWTDDDFPCVVCEDLDASGVPCSPSCTGVSA
jgi:hypothetical protein